MPIRRARADGSTDASNHLRQRAAERHRAQLEGPVAPGPCPPGWHVGPPDFVGVGVQKAGTTWWHGLLSSHPQVEAALRKELHYFQHGWQREQAAADIEAYHRYFARPPGHLSGEWTPRYMVDPWTPARLAEAAPHAKLLVLLRDPIERFRSHATHAMARHGALHPRFLVEATERGRYHSQLLRLLRHFDRDRLLVLQLEQCAEQPAEQLARTFRFLGIDDAFTPPDVASVVYGATTTRVPLPADLVAELRLIYRPEAEALEAAWPDIDVGRWQSLW